MELINLKYTKIEINEKGLVKKKKKNGTIQL